MWIDNFSRIYGNKFVREFRGPFDKCLWTVSGMHSMSLDLRFRYDENIHVLSCIPGENLFAQKVDLLAEFNEFDLGCSSGDCLPFTLDEVHYPPGIPNMHCTKYASADADFGVHTRELSRVSFVPIGISEDNCGSNLGLLNVIISSLMNNIVDGELQNYTWILCDINIFNRVLKVCQCNLLSSCV